MILKVFRELKRCVEFTGFKTFVRQYMDRKKPNYFVAVKISNPEIHTALQCLQDYIVEQDQRLKKCMTSLATLHITLMVMNISDDETHTKCLEAIKNVFDEWNEIICKDPLLLEFQGVGNFHNTVLFAKLLEGKSFDRLCNLADSVKQQFANLSIYTTDSRSTFTPHLTIAKLRHEDGTKKNIRKINPSFYEDFENKYFGKQLVEGIQLLSMEDERTETGYYLGDEFLFCLPSMSETSNNPDSMIASEKKKEEVRVKISNLVHDALK